VSSWNASPSVRFAVHFGDLVDGYCPKDQSQTAVSRVSTLGSASLLPATLFCLSSEQ